MLFTETIEPTEVDPSTPLAVQKVFGWDRPEPVSRRFVATCFFDYDNETEQYVNADMPRVALLDPSGAQWLFIHSNSWRGDRYAGWLLEVCQRWSDAQ